MEVNEKPFRYCRRDFDALESGGWLEGVRLAGVTGEALTGSIICAC
jgi:hypothetical protein